MRDELFCVICESKKEDISDNKVYNDICPKCGNATLYVEDLSSWICIKKINTNYDDIFYISSTRGGYTWIEIYKGEEKYKKLVNILVSQDDVEVLENDPHGRFVYNRNGHKFQIILIHYVDYLLSQYDLWDGKPFIEFEFVKKDDPNFEIYKQELKMISDVLQ